MSAAPSFPIPTRIGSKDVYVVEEHNHAFEAWAAIRSGLAQAPILISLDHHTDSHTGFGYWLCRTGKIKLGDSPDRAVELMANEVALVDRTKPSAVAEAAERLKNDEHIDAAIGAGIINHAYVINFQEYFGTRSNEHEAWNAASEGIPPFLREPEPSGPYSYSMPANRIFEIPAGCAVGCMRMPHTDDCQRPHYDQAIERIYLEERLRTLTQMAKAARIEDIFCEKYVLDIDLDYFHTTKAIAPDDPSIFYKMIKDAVAITIATEPRFVISTRLEGEAVDADYLLTKLKEHIHRATK